MGPCAGTERQCYSRAADACSIYRVGGLPGLDQQEDGTVLLAGGGGQRRWQRVKRCDLRRSGKWSPSSAPQQPDQQVGLLTADGLQGHAAEVVAATPVRMRRQAPPSCTTCKQDCCSRCCLS